MKRFEKKFMFIFLEGFDVNFFVQTKNSLRGSLIKIEEKKLK
jgi:hypothetical protein